MGNDPTWPSQTVPRLAIWVHTVVLLSKFLGAVRLPGLGSGIRTFWAKEPFTPVRLEAPYSLHDLVGVVRRVSAEGLEPS